MRISTPHLTPSTLSLTIYRMLFISLTILPLAVVVMYLLLGLLLTGVTLYFPNHMALMNARTAYYLFGREQSVSDSLRRLKDASLAYAGWGASVRAEL